MLWYLAHLSDLVGMYHITCITSNKIDCLITIDFGELDRKAEIPVSDIDEIVYNDKLPIYKHSINRYCKFNLEPQQLYRLIS